jgi:hypothetical protein
VDFGRGRSHPLLVFIFRLLSARQAALSQRAGRSSGPTTSCDSAVPSS